MTIPNGWTTAQLEDGIELLSGQHILANEYTHLPPGIPYLTGPADFPNGKIVVTKYTIQPKVTCKPGNILVTIKGSGTGKIILADHEYCISRQLAAVRAKHWDSKFIFYFLQSNNSRYAGAAAGLIPGIARDDILKTPISLPPLPEQRKIAEILSTWDEAIDLTARLLAAKQRRKQALMQRLLTGKVRFPGFHNSWRKVSLKELLTPIVRKVKKPQESYTALSIRSHGKGAFRRAVDDPDEVAMTELYQVQDGDLMVNITFAWEGAIAIVNQEDAGCYVSHRFPTYRFNENTIVRDFFRYVMVTKQFFYELGLISPGGAGRNRVLNKTDFLNIHIFMPDISEQQKIASLLIGCDQEIDLLQQKLAALHQQKQGLMQQLLTGKVRMVV